MRFRFYIKSLVFLTIFTALLIGFGTAAAYEAKEKRGLDCDGGREPVGDLGITGMSMKGSLSIDTDDREYRWLFQGEPKINRIDPHGPSAGILKSGDVIVAIDGLPITTRKAGLRFGNLVPGEPVELTVRRGRRMFKCEIEPIPVCLEDHPLYLGAPDPPDLVINEEGLEQLSKAIENLAIIDVPGIPELPDLSYLTTLDVRPRAWFGMGLSCDGCTIRTSREDQAARWDFDNPPKVESVETGGPADEAGLREGDTLLEIDGTRLDTRKGGERFSSIEPGETVTWTIRRDGERATVEMLALEHPDRPEVTRGHVIIHEESPVRFTGVLGGMDIEVRGKKSVQVSRDDSAGEIVIKTRDAVIRLRRIDKAE